ncbi:MAG: WXG100 family type VII secretion target [Clostridium sp.]|nr:WXG100 family type VII secretion target [Clostridium sp.]
MDLSAYEIRKENEIRANTEELDKLARKYSSLSSQAENILNKINGISGRMDANWNGRAGDSFNGKYNNWKSTISRYTENLRRASSELRRVSNNLKSTDR